LFCKFLKFTGRNSFKGNDIPVKEDVKAKDKHDHRRKAGDYHETLSERHYTSKSQHEGNYCHGDRIKPEKYDGNSTFETFMIQFDNFAEHNHWNDLSKLHYLRWAVTRTATQMLLGTEGMTYRQLLARLRSRFGNQEMEAKYLTELQCRRRNKGESFKELAQDIRRLMLLSYPHERSSMSENMEKEYFIAAIDDPELELKVREKEPKTLDAAQNYAQRLEMYNGAVHQGHRRYARKVTASPDSRSSSLEERIVKHDHSRSKSRQRRDESSSQNRETMKLVCQVNATRRKEETTTGLCAINQSINQGLPK